MSKCHQYFKIILTFICPAEADLHLQKPQRLENTAIQILCFKRPTRGQHKTQQCSFLLFFLMKKITSGFTAIDLNEICLLA